jgi:spermidine synthase
MEPGIMISISKRSLYTILFGLFLGSGFCSLLYQVVWLRLAFAAFGVITPVLSIVLSVFMLGLSVGSWFGGRWITALAARMGRSAIWFYAGSELLLGIGGLAVPMIFAAGQAALLPAGTMDSTRYLLLSALVLGASILPWCVLMGFTYPLMMAFIREVDEANTTGFSYLYLANVIGAMLGTLMTAIVLIELLGLQRTSWVAVGVNFGIAAVSVGLTRLSFGPRSGQCLMASPLEARVHDGVRSPLVPSILFATGLISMAMEVVWTRAFTPVLITTIYSFAKLLAVYLMATWIGSLVYRLHLARGRTRATAELLALLAATSLLPAIVNDPRVPWTGRMAATITLLSIVPFCGCLGYLTPRLIDDYARGEPEAAGRAYAVNIVGGILGPLFAGYLLLPYFGVRQSMIILALPLLAFFILEIRAAFQRPVFGTVTTAATTAVLATATLFSTSYEERSYYKSGELRRDYVATVLASGQGRDKLLFVNGIAMTHLTPITKVMAHLPMFTRERKPEAALVICLGIGTTLRSVESADVDVTAVELVPSVRQVFSYFHPDAEALLRKPNCRVIIDDGRRFLRRTDKKYDVITIDPPPPVEAAGSSLLYSSQFYQLIKARLSDGGMLQTWYPGGDKLTFQAFARAIVDEFPYVRVYRSIEDWGYHFSASMQPFEKPTVEQFIARMPERARTDLLEWAGGKSLEDYVAEILKREIPVAEILNPDPDVCITDDRPYNEYYFLRRAYYFLFLRRAWDTLTLGRSPYISMFGGGSRTRSTAWQIAPEVAAEHAGGDHPGGGQRGGSLATTMDQRGEPVGGGRGPRPGRVERGRSLRHGAVSRSGA